MAETKTWMTPARIARGPEAANAELRRWAHVRYERGTSAPRQYSSVATMRSDETASKREHVGSRVVSAAKHKHVDYVLIAAATAGAIGLGVLIGRWWAKRKREQEQR